MKIKTFTGKTLPEALVKAKREFGDEIIILESREIPATRTKSKQKIIEVTVSIDNTAEKKRIQTWTPPVLKPEGKKAQPQTYTGQNNEFSKVIGDILARKPKELNQEKKILDELADLREQVSRLGGTSKKEKESVDSSVFPDVYLKMQEHLVDKGVDEKLASRFIKRAYVTTENGPAADIQEIKQILKKEMGLAFKTYNFKKAGKKNEPRVVLLVGATGVGKTTTAMKLASFQEIYGKNEVAIISTDPYGPSEALKAFSKMNGTSIYEKKRVDELPELISKFKKKEVVIVDTPGQSPFTPNYLSKLEEYVKAVKPTEIFLVLAMSTDLKDLFLASAIYMLLKPDGIILSKFDETTQPGKVFPIINEMNLPVAAICDGKRIFMDISLGDPEYVLNKLFEKSGSLAHVE